jgi:hypothetical protein
MDSHPLSKPKKSADTEKWSETSAAIGLDILRPWLQRWWAISLGLLLVIGVSGGCGAWLLLQQSANPNCRFVFWPFASASLRLYCAQEAASRKNLEDLFEAIGLIDGLPMEHPLRPILNRRIEEWSKQALDLAEEEFHQGRLNRAIEFAKRIPSRTNAHRLVNQRIGYWQKVWAEGEKIYKAAEEKLVGQENWRAAFGVMVQLLSLDNRYWAKEKYESFNERIMQAQKDEVLLVKAERLLEAGGIDNLTKALNQLQELGDGTIFKKSIQTATEKIGRALIEIAENSLNQQELSDALAALERIPQTVSFWPEVQDWISISNAMADTWTGTVGGYQSAIGQLQKVSTDRPLYNRMQNFIQGWMAEIGYVRVLEQAQAKAADGTVGSLWAAIAMAQQIPSNSQQSESSKQLIADWRMSIDVQQEATLPRPVEISPANGQQTVALPEQDFGALNNVESFPQQPVRPAAPRQTTGNAFESPEQQLLREARRTAENGTPQSLASAIETANQVSSQSSLRTEAELAMDTWGQRILEMAIQQAETDPRGAITIATQVPKSSSAYQSAQEQIQVWQAR